MYQSVYVYVYVCVYNSSSSNNNNNNRNFFDLQVTNSHCKLKFETNLSREDS